MAREKEIKLILKIPLGEFVERVCERGYQPLHKIEQTDIYFDTRDWYLYEHVAALRLRQVNGKDDSFCFKKVYYFPNRREKYYVEEIEVSLPLSWLIEVNQIFERLGIPKIEEILTSRQLTDYLAQHQYFDEQKMPKARTVYACGADEIVIDEVDQVGVIVELECQENEPLEIVGSLLDESEWERSIEGTSYIWLRRVKGLSSHLSNLEKFSQKPDWNVWDHERKWYSDTANGG